MGARLAAVLAALVLVPGEEVGAQEAPVQEDDAPSLQPRQEDAPPIVEAIEVTGLVRYREDQMIAALGQAVGAPLDRNTIDQGLDVLFHTYKVLAVVLERPTGDGRVVLRVDVQELPLDLEPRFFGNVEIDEEELFEWAGLEEGEVLFLYEAENVKRRLLRRYKEEGFYFAEVSDVRREGGIDPETGEEVAPDVIFEIQEGPKVRVRDVVLHGNDFAPERGFLFFKRGLKKLARVELHGPRLLTFFASDFVEETLQADLIAMRDVYRDFGFLDAVVELEELEFSDERDWVTIHVAIDEGGRFTVGSVAIEGVEIFEDKDTPRGTGERPAELVIPEEELFELLEIEVGRAYERRLQEADARTLRDHYGERGYVSHRSLSPWDRWEFLEPELVFEEEAPVVHVTYRIAQGRRIFIREIPIAGNLHTRDRVIRSRITVEPGELADLEEIERSRSRIQSTGWFSDPRDIGHVEPQYRFIDTEDPDWKDLEFFVDEGQVLTFRASGGVSSNFGAFGTVEVRQRNFDIANLPRSPWTTIEDIAARQAFHGAGQQLVLRASPGTRASFFDVLFTEPDIFRLHRRAISLTLTARRRLRLYDSHDEEREEAGFELGRLITPDSQVFVGYTFGTVEVDDLSVGGEPTIGSPLTVPRALKAQEGESDLSTLNLGYRFRRVDVPLGTRNGVALNFRTEISDEALGSDFEFVKSELDFDWWKEFDDDPDLVSHRIHTTLSAGVAVPYGDSDFVPYTERFFDGGQRRNRAFDWRGVGPNENGFARGGETQLYGSFEYRRPLLKQTQPGTYRELEMMQWGIFFDAGVLGPHDFSLDLDETRMSAGFLFGLTVPLPVTFSFGWPIREGDGDDTQFVGFSIGI